MKWIKVNHLEIVGGKSNIIEQDKDKDNHLEIVGGKCNNVEQEGWNVDGHARTEKSSSQTELHTDLSISFDNAVILKRKITHLDLLLRTLM